MKAKLVRVIALDPGGSTGWATFSAVHSGDQYLLSEYEWGKLGPLEHHSELWNLLDNFSDTYSYDEQLKLERLHIVTESFEYRNNSRMGLDMISREYIGILKLFAENATFPVSFQQQSPSIAKTFVKNENLRRFGMYISSKKEDSHAMDACRHLLYYLIHNAKIMPQEFLTRGWKS